MGLSGWYGHDRKKWVGPNTADSYVPDLTLTLNGEYHGDYGWDSPGPAAGSKACEPARG